ncbi:MAG TPA: hypothetical protein VHW69_14400 [Rhizomicrobium sp.]|jgi:hypothetical protein|nr:hypothetical protein [Rhizomicrobium sp.]
MLELGYIVVAVVAVIALPLAFALAVNVVKRSLKDSSGSTPEYIAYGMLGLIARVERKSLTAGSPGANPDRKWLLDTFAECMEATKNPERRSGRNDNV